MYFIESINSFCPFTAYKCESWDKYSKGECVTCGRDGCSTVGYYADDFDVLGSFYVATTEKAPFCASNFIFELRLSQKSPDSQGELVLTLDKDKAPKTIQLTT